MYTKTENIITGIIVAIVIVGLYRSMYYNEAKINSNPEFSIGKVVDLKQAPKSQYRIYYEFITYDKIKITDNTLLSVPITFDYFSEKTKGKYFMIKYEKNNPENNILLLKYPIR